MIGLSLLAQARLRLLRGLVESHLTISGDTVSIADSSSRTSRELARHFYDAVLQTIGQDVGADRDEAKGQTAGEAFEGAIVSFLKEAMPLMEAVRPGRWTIAKSGGALSRQLTRQYAHLAALADLVKSQPQLQAMLGNDYLIAPDVIVLREAEDDAAFNRLAPVLDSSIAQHADLRRQADASALLHASVSCKWTLRSDRAQNARSEALNLLRNRKGRAPHIVVVTAEPMPGRIASIALGTGDIDCVYHLGLPELARAVAAVGSDDARELLTTMVEGRRLKDIADLPVDLAV